MIRICNPDRPPRQGVARTWRFALPFPLLLLGIVEAASAAPGEPSADPLGVWLAELRLPDSVVRALQARRAVDAQARQWIVQDGEQVYVLAEQPVAANARAQIRQAQRGIAEMRARHGLLLYAAGEAYQQQGFTNREAIAKALTTLDGATEGRLLSGLQSRATVLETSVAALVWTPEDRILAYRRQPPPPARFLPAYCEALYPTAKGLFLEGRHRPALGLYQEMYARQCQQPLAYFLDAADCFAALSQPRDAQRMVNHLLNESTLSLSGDVLERAGDLLFQTGDEEGAKRAYEQALELLR